MQAKVTAMLFVHKPLLGGKRGHVGQFNLLKSSKDLTLGGHQEVMVIIISSAIHCLHFVLASSFDRDATTT